MSAEQWTRIPAPQLVTQLAANARVWIKEVADGRLKVMRTLEQMEPGGRWLAHVSISFSRPGATERDWRYPTWEEQKEAVWRFAPGKTMVSYLPAEGTPYVNVHSTTFHWWEEEPSSFERKVQHEPR